MKKKLNLSRYFTALETFKVEHHDEVIKYWKTEKAFDNMVKQLKKKEKQIARDAMKSHGDVEKYMDEMISNLGHLSEVVNELMHSGKEEFDRSPHRPCKPWIFRL